jgi:hypothetical protein
MGDKARQYRPAHVRRLDTLSGNVCAFPNCERKLVARDGETIVSKICHIEAASKKGPRFNDEMDDDHRRHFNNLILMCDECHNIIDNMDNESKYTVTILQQWKKDHKEKIESLSKPNFTSLSLAINAIAAIVFEGNASNQDSDPDVFNIEAKIEHNCVVRNLELINEYKVFYPKIATLYSELETQGSFKKENLLRNIRRIYLKVIGRYVGKSLNRIKIIQANADSIIEDVEEELLKSCEASSLADQDDISFGLSVIMVDAFMRCKILEEPPRK